MTLLAVSIITALAVGGLSLVVFNGRKLISDWPRPKPVHNVDLAWIQVYLGLAMIVAAWFIFDDPSRVLREPTPTPITADAMAQEAAEKSRR